MVVVSRRLDASSLDQDDEVYSGDPEFMTNNAYQVVVCLVEGRLMMEDVLYVVLIRYMYTANIIQYIAIEGEETNAVMEVGGITIVVVATVKNKGRPNKE